MVQRTWLTRQSSRSAVSILLACAFVQLGCSHDPTASLAPVIQELRIVGEVESSGNEYKGVVTIVNTSDFRVEFGIARFGCAVPLKLYSAEGILVWNQSQVTGSRPGGCKWLPEEVELSRGSSIRVTSEGVTEAELLGVLQPGEYRAELQVIFARIIPHETLAGALTTRIDSVVAVPAGTLHLD